MKKKIIPLIIIIAMFFNCFYPVMAATDVTADDKESSVEFETYISSINDDNTIDDYGFDKNLKIENGGILTLMIRVTDSGYLKESTISFDSPNFILSDKCDVEVSKITSVSDVKNQASSIDNTIIEEAKVDIETKNKEINSSGVGSLSYSTTSKIFSMAQQYESVVENEEGKPSNNSMIETKDESAKESKADKTPEVSETTSTNIVKEIKNNTITLNQITSNRNVFISIPVSFEKNTSVKPSYYSQETNISFTGKFVKNEKEKDINRSKKIKVSWYTDVETNIDQQIVRFIKYEDNKALLSMKLFDEIVNDKLPYNKKEYEVKIPNINGTLPQSAIIIAKNVTYSVDGDSLKITRTNVDTKDTISAETSDVTIITYFYEMDNIPAEISISSDVHEAIELVVGSQVEAKLEGTAYSCAGETGKIVDMTLSAPAELSKGFMYSNLDKTDNKFDTDFYELLTIDIGYKDLIDRVVLSQNNTDTSLITKKIQIDAEDFLNVLGNDGFVKVIDIDGNELSTINLSNLELNIYTDKSIRLETSKPISEGSFPILITRAINSRLNFSREEIRQIPSLTDNLTVKSYMQDKEVSTGTINLKIDLVDPVSKATVEISNTNLSTVETNKDVEIVATLETDSIDDALFKNPTLTFTLPEAVKEINVKDAKLVYEEELVPAEYTSYGNTINVKLSGTQTKYSSLAISKGTKVNIIADVVLDDLSTSSFNKVTLVYTNSNTSERNAVETEVNVIAPDDFVITNETTISPKGEQTLKLLAREAANQEYKFKGNWGKEQTVTVSGVAVNNLGYNATGVKILGRTFNSDTLKSDQSNESFESNMSTTMNGAIYVSSVGSYQVYYSDNGQANVDLEDQNNNWSTTFNPNAKSYLIVANNEIAFGQQIRFKYDASIPRDVDYDRQASQMFSVYYTSNQSMLKNSATCKIYTTTKPIIDIGITAKNFLTGEEIYQDSVANYGDIIQYTVSIRNDSNGSISNVNSIIKFDVGSAAFINKSWDGVKPYSEYLTSDKEIRTNIPTLSRGEIKTIQFNVFVGNGIGTNKPLTLRDVVTADDMDDEAANSFTVKGGDGRIVSKLSISENEKTSYNTGDTITFSAVINKQLSRTIDSLDSATVTLQLPDSLEFKSGDNIEYNKKKNLLTFDTSKMINETNYLHFSFELTVKDSKAETNNELVINANYTYTKNGEKIEKSFNSNKLKVITGSINQTEFAFESNIKEKEITEEKDLIYSIKIKNNSSESMKIKIEDTLPKQLNVYSIICDSNSRIFNLKAENNFLYTGKLESNELLNITIKTKAYILADTYEIENDPKVYINDREIEVTPIKHKIGKDKSKETNVTTTSNLVKNSILGLAWEDSNGDGLRQDDEKLLSGIEFALYNKLTNQIARDANNIEIKATTNNEGRYELNNVPNGNYYIVAKYDNSKFKVAKYDIKTSENTNSDFINTTLNDEKVASSDIISLDYNNEYNVDLGLDSNNVFDLSLDLSISKVTVTNPKKGNDEKEYAENKILKHEFEPNRVDNDTVIIEYKIKVTNEGKVPGYATSIADYIPDEMTFNSELNKEWILIDDVAYNNSLLNKIINPGETKELKIILTKKMDGDSVGIVHNIAEIVSDYNEKALTDIDSTPKNFDSSEDDISSADIYLGITTGIKIAYKYALVIICAGIVIYMVIMSIAEGDKKKRNKIKKWKK